MMKHGNGRGGFSLIEILVATTILLVIVILASLVFQQTTGAYDTGERRVGANVALRNIVGAIGRDLTLAVDSEEYKGMPANKWDDRTIQFAALTGRAGYNAKGEKDPDCGTLQLITYTTDTTGQNVQRTAQSYKYDNGSGKWSPCGKAAESDVYKGTSFKNASIHVKFTPSDNESLPEHLYIRADLETDGETAAVGVGSRGRNGSWDQTGKTTDDIWVGLKP